MAPMSPSLTWNRRLTTTMTRVITRQTRATKTMMNPSAMFLVAVVTTCLLFDQVTAAKGKSEDMLRDVADISAEIDLRESWFSLLERLKRDNSDQEPYLLRRKRATEETGETTFDVELLEKRHELFVSDETELSRQKRNNEVEEDISREVLSRVKRNDDDAKLSNTEDVVLEKSVQGHSEEELSRQKRAEEETEELELSRQKRTRQEPEEQELLRQKRAEQAPEEQELSRQKRTEQEPEEHELSRQKRTEDEPELSREKRAEEETRDKDERILSRQKRQETEGKELSRQKRADGTDGEEELTRVKRVKRAPSDPQDLQDSFLVSSADQLLNSPSEDEELSRQKRHDDSSEEKVLSRKKRRLLQFSEENLDDGISHTSREKPPSSKASSKESSTKHSGESQKDKKGDAPEHRNYHEDLLQRRMKVVKMENKRRKKGRTSDIDPEDEDDWDQELRIRRELAEKAIEYGIQQRKERMKNPELYGRELTILQRIKQDAEEILRRRKEAKMGQKPMLTDTSLFIPESANTQGENAEEGEVEEEERKGKKKTAKAIRKLLNLGKGGKKGGSSASKHSLPEQSPQGIEGNPDTPEAEGFNPYAAENVLRFEKSQKKGKRGKGTRKKRKQGRLF